MDAATPHFEHPPIDEVVFSTQFDVLNRFYVPYFGLLWEHFRAEYPACEEATPLIGVLEGPEGPAMVGPDISDVAFLPRVWFVQPDGPGLIQVQRDRFLMNWRRRRPEDEYPGFDAVFRRFRQHLGEFDAFLTDHAIGELAMQQFELTYINLISRGEGWLTPNDIPRVLPALAWRWNAEHGVLGNPQAMNWQVAFPLPENRGRLHVSLQLARRRSDQMPILRLELTARGIGHDRSRDGTWAWFELANQAVVRAFLEITSEEVQREVWRRQ